MTADPQQVLPRLARLLDGIDPARLREGRKGIEKESLRITRDGLIAQTPHPKPLGSALTHPHITTDYSEALLEFITPPYLEVDDALEYLRDIHLFVYEQLGDELLLGASMPCGIDGDESIPIARYGSSNLGRFKHIYRHGLWHRYGRAMQSIAGIHFNYSVPAPIWETLHHNEGDSSELTDFISANYFGMMRNLKRQGWLILYLFGSSPAVCKRFFTSRPHLMAGFAEFDNGTLYYPYATSLRMSDIGYKSENQTQLAIDDATLTGYVSSLNRAVSTPYPTYEKIGIRVDGDFRQLSTSILQIENEFYSTVRPKQVAEPGERPLRALQRRGVRYLELRSLDLDLNCPIGIEDDTARFIEAFMLTCLFQPSPVITDEERRAINDNQLNVSQRGREPGLLLRRGLRTISLRDWAEEILAAMRPLCRLLDGDDPRRPYTVALERHDQAVRDPEQTPSAIMLKAMRTSGQSFAAYALKRSIEHHQTMRSQPLPERRRHAFQEMARVSIAKQRQLEQSDDMDFDAFLSDYFKQRCD